MIEFKNVTKKFGDFTAVENISFKVEPSSIYGLIGYNGAGKTTLLKTAAGIYKAEVGSVTMDNQNTFDNPVIRKSMFYIPDDLYFPMNASIKSMAKLYADYYPNFSYKTLENLLEVFGLDYKKKIRGFSKGMQRQTEIILALASRPRFMLLDETFDGLDPQKKDITKKLFVEYVAESGCSLIISSHNLPELSDLCDNVGLINGKHLTMDCSVYDISDNYRKYRLIFNRDITEEDFKDIQYKSLEIDGKIVTVIFDKNSQDQKDKLNALLPMAIDEYRLTMEEVFLNEMEDKKYDITKIFEK
ncbi:MAG: ABC transporter ATP-binding protein [Oscillospiraceae bacterium]|nr:ABC transporter ATP-binding protein [Oscillospiraceae bacterium]